MYAHYHSRLNENRAWIRKLEALWASEAEANRKETWLAAVLECLGEVAGDIPCYGDSFPEEEWCSASRARHLSRRPLGGSDKCRRALAAKKDPPPPRRRSSRS